MAVLYCMVNSLFPDIMCIGFTEKDSYVHLSELNKEITKYKMIPANSYHYLIVRKLKNPKKNLTDILEKNSTNVISRVSNEINFIRISSEKILEIISNITEKPDELPSYADLDSHSSSLRQERESTLQQLRSSIADLRISPSSPQIPELTLHELTCNIAITVIENLPKILNLDRSIRNAPYQFSPLHSRTYQDLFDDGQIVAFLQRNQETAYAYFDKELVSFYQPSKNTYFSSLSAFAGANCGRLSVNGWHECYTLDIALNKWIRAEIYSMQKTVL